MALLELKTTGVVQDPQQQASTTKVEEAPTTPEFSKHFVLANTDSLQDLNRNELDALSPILHLGSDESGIIQQFEQVVSDIDGKTKHGIMAEIECRYEGKLHIQFTVDSRRLAYAIQHLLTSYGKYSQGSLEFETFGVKNYNPEMLWGTLYTTTAKVESTSRGLDALKDFIERKIPVCVAQNDLPYTLPYRDFTRQLSVWSPELYKSGFICLFEQTVYEVNQVAATTENPIQTEIDCLDGEQLYIKFTMCKNLAFAVKEFLESYERNSEEGIAFQKFGEQIIHYKATGLWFVTVSVDPFHNGLDALNRFIEHQILPRAQNYSQSPPPPPVSGLTSCQ